MSGNEKIATRHVAEALALRQFDRDSVCA